MNLEVQTADPLGILTSTARVLQRPDYVGLSENGLDLLAGQIKAKLDSGLNITGADFGAPDDLTKAVQLIFLQTGCNFCFWAETGQPKWQIEWQGREVSGGFGMITAFTRALAERPQILEAKYLAKISREDVADLFRSNNGTEIPLMKERWENLREAGQILQQRYKGQFINAVEVANHDAVQLAQLLYDHFPSYRDVAILDGQEVKFLKRAQICGNDLASLNKSGKQSLIKNWEQLTAFADYKIPQVLRAAGVLVYTKKLADMTDDQVLLPPGSREEVEIRSATVWGVELLRQKLGQYSASEIDNAIWHLSQGVTDLAPYHRTRTIFY